MNENEMCIIRELCKALNVPFLEKKVWPTKEVEEDIRNDAVTLGFIKEKDKYKHSASMIQAVIDEGTHFCWDARKPEDFFAPLYKVKLDTVIFEGEEIDAKWFSEYHAAKTYLEIKHGRYGDIDYVRL